MVNDLEAAVIDGRTPAPVYWLGFCVLGRISEQFSGAGFGNSVGALTATPPVVWAMSIHLMAMSHDLEAFATPVKD